MTTSNTNATNVQKPAYRGKQSSKPTGQKRPPRRMTASMEEAVKMIKKLNGRNKIYGMMSTNERGDITEIGVYNGITKKYALYRTDLVDSDTVAEFKELIGA